MGTLDKYIDKKWKLQNIGHISSASPIIGDNNWHCLIQSTWNKSEYKTLLSVTPDTWYDNYVPFCAA